MAGSALREVFSPPQPSCPFAFAAGPGPLPDRSVRLSCDSRRSRVLGESPSAWGSHTSGAFLRDLEEPPALRCRHWERLDSGRQFGKGERADTLDERSGSIARLGTRPSRASLVSSRVFLERVFQRIHFKR